MEEIVDPTGAGDSFAGGFIGYISQKNDVSISTMKEAVVYGNVLGAFSVEDFGIRRLIDITRKDVDARYKKYRSIVHY
jgi:sugar/nucleoside kinase (ribokinase family)